MFIILTYLLLYELQINYLRPITFHIIQIILNCNTPTQFTIDHNHKYDPVSHNLEDPKTTNIII